MVTSVGRGRFARKARLTALIATAGLTIIGYAQTTAGAVAQPVFEVASIKRSKNAAPNFTAFDPGGLRFSATNASLKLLVMTAYDVNDRHVAGGPSWFNSEFYNIEAKAEHPVSPGQIHSMLQTLLADRFKLMLHKETKPLPTYILRCKESNRKLRSNRSGGEARIRRDSDGRTIFENVPMGQLAWFIAVRMRRDVVDETGLKGNYDFEVAWTPDLLRGVGQDGTAAPSDLDNASIFAALREQLGLVLIAEKRPAEILVIDHAEKPSPN